MRQEAMNFHGGHWGYGLGLMLMGVLSSCAHNSSLLFRDQDPVTFFERLCRPYQKNGQTLGSRGSIWVRASHVGQGIQFPADVEASPQKGFVLEVTDLLGETQVLIQRQGHQYLFQEPGRRVRRVNHSSRWGNLPIAWAETLLSGNLPCPDQPTRIQWDKEGHLLVELAPREPKKSVEKWVYELETWGSVPKVKRLKWHFHQGRLNLEFKKRDLETGHAKEWAVSSTQGQVRVRWKRRKWVP